MIVNHFVLIFLVLLLGIKVETKGTMDSVGVQTVGEFYEPLMALGVGVCLLAKLYSSKISQTVSSVVGAPDTTVVDTPVITPRLFFPLHVLGSPFQVLSFLNYPSLINFQRLNREQRDAVANHWRLEIEKRRTLYCELLEQNRLMKSIVIMCEHFELLVHRHGNTRPLGDTTWLLERVPEVSPQKLEVIETCRYLLRMMSFIEYTVFSRFTRFGNEEIYDENKPSLNLIVHKPTGAPGSGTNWNIDCIDSMGKKVKELKFTIESLESTLHPSTYLKAYSNGDLENSRLLESPNISEGQRKRITLQQEAKYKKLLCESNVFLKMKIEEFMSTTVPGYVGYHCNVYRFFSWNQDLFGFLITSNNMDHKVELMMQVEKLKKQSKYCRCNGIDSYNTRILRGSIVKFTGEISGTALMLMCVPRQYPEPYYSLVILRMLEYFVPLSEYSRSTRIYL